MDTRDLAVLVQGYKALLEKAEDTILKLEKKNAEYQEDLERAREERKVLKAEIKALQGRGGNQND